MNGRFWLVVALLLCGTRAMDAQEAMQPAACTYQSCALRVEPGFFGHVLVRGAAGERIGRAFSNAKLLMNGDSSVVYVERYQRATRTATILQLVGLAGMTAFYAMAMDNRVDRTNGLAVGAVAVSVVSLYASIPFMIRAQRSLSQAVWWHNSEFGR